MAKQFEGKVALVTGAASPRGLGRAIANTIARDGGDVVVVDLNKEQIEQAAAEIAKEFGVKTLGFPVNVTKPEDCDAAISAVKEKFGKLDFLVNNAGVLKDNLFIRMSEQEFDFVMDVNAKGVFLMTKSASKLLLKAPSGRIVNISSLSGLSGQPGQANYSSSKAAVIALTKVAAREFSGRNVLVNAVCPGYVQTDMTASLPEEVQKKLTDPMFIPLKRPGTQQEIANAVEFFLSDKASYITGTFLRVDGGAGIGM
ncbi:glucose 1-dehydrogenase [Leptospira wolffii]|uniref:Glucose 1-dehydrogenase n=1 Tax=Leptospira wolffii TaxID=409998 RepID=A0A2M9Z939_9LEPT|nr:glucose 1-dehydrogenase [Leptospira wolffii]EPG65721.1 KR domain protein [Leptospira wolffii serovar Khorat str. Khorat-H2]PJZ64923.1 SDR family oxidoreductase [Leptospira wolffii]TGK58167.1 glucose 1-dehydrogenase [Leptospira wolffii]TGK68845.1 glucose 1-dehydrogenase [Leptospira wolffii]TGK76315.1 glucose 1-dehydrogenase [Leptospira wolffii]